jgi:hypothetical protein
VQEFDDTEGAERIHTYHKAGTFEEIHPDGTRVQKIVGDNFEIVAKDNNVYVKGTCNITVDGTTNLKSGGKVTVEAPEVDLGTSAPEPMVMGDKLKAWIEGVLVTHSNSHVHIGNLGAPTSPATSPLVAEDVYSKKNRTQD